ncbi:hypothetical protein CsSME_00042601 [Camellia sinensis var. sinensis]
MYFLNTNTWQGDTDVSAKVPRVQVVTPRLSRQGRGRVFSSFTGGSGATRRVKLCRSNAFTAHSVAGHGEFVIQWESFSKNTTSILCI